jgi:hypothetical protein
MSYELGIIGRRMLNIEFGEIIFRATKYPTFDIRYPTFDIQNPHGGTPADNADSATC